MFNQFNRIIAHLYGELPAEEESILLAEAARRATVRKQIAQWRQLLTAYRLAPPLVAPKIALPTPAAENPDKDISASSPKKNAAPPKKKSAGKISDRENLVKSADLLINKISAETAPAVKDAPADAEFDDNPVEPENLRADISADDEIGLLKKFSPANPAPEISASAVPVAPPAAIVPLAAPQNVSANGSANAADRESRAPAEIPPEIKISTPPDAPVAPEIANDNDSDPHYPPPRRERPDFRTPQPPFAVSRIGAMVRLAAAFCIGALIFFAARDKKNAPAPQPANPEIISAPASPAATAPLDTVTIVPSPETAPAVETADIRESEPPLSHPLDTPAASDTLAANNPAEDTLAAETEIFAWTAPPFAPIGNVKIPAIATTNSEDELESALARVIDYPQNARGVSNLAPSNVEPETSNESAIIEMVTVIAPHENLAAQTKNSATVPEIARLPRETRPPLPSSGYAVLDDAQQLYRDDKLLSALFALDNPAIDKLPRPERAQALALKARVELKLNRLLDMQATIESLRELNPLDAQALTKLRELALKNRDRQNGVEPRLLPANPPPSPPNRENQTLPKSPSVPPLTDYAADISDTSAISAPTPRKKRYPHFSTDPYEYYR